MNTSSKQLVTIVSPVNNEQGNIVTFCDRVQKAFEPINDRYEVEILFVDDGSVDDTLKIIQETNQKRPWVKGLVLSRNFGFQAALSAGLKHAEGDIVCIITAGLADPPELLADFVIKSEEGYDIVYGIRGKRPEPQWITGLRNYFYKTLRLVADTDIILNMSEISMLKRHVLDIVLETHNQFPFIRADISYVGFKRIGIPYDIQPRHSGKSHYNLWRMTKFAVAGILSISTYPLRVSVYLFPILILVNILFFTLSEFLNPIFFKGLIAFDLVYISLQLTFIGLYIARVYKNIIHRPIYVIDWNRTVYN